MLSSSMILSTTSRLVLYALSPSFSNCLNSFSTVLWSFFSRTMASGTGGPPGSRLRLSLPRRGRIDHAVARRRGQPVGEHGDQPGRLVGGQPGGRHAPAVAPRAQHDAAHLQVPGHPQRPVTGTGVGEPLTPGSQVLPWDVRPDRHAVSLCPACPAVQGRSGYWHREERCTTEGSGVVVDLTATRVLARSGLLKPARPDQLIGMALAFARWGLTPATGYAAGAARHPSQAAIIDDQGVLTWREVDQRTDRIAGELRARGIAEGDAVGLLARNGRGFVEASTALSKCGADVLNLNTGSAASQIDEVLTREKASALLHDAEFGELLAEAARGRVAITTERLGEIATEPGPGAPP